MLTFVNSFIMSLVILTLLFLLIKLFPFKAKNFINVNYYKTIYLAKVIPITLCYTLCYTLSLLILLIQIIVKSKYYYDERTSALIAMYLLGKYKDFKLLHPFYESPFPMYDCTRYVTLIFSSVPPSSFVCLYSYIVFTLAQLLLFIITVHLLLKKLARHAISTIICPIVLMSILSPPLSIIGSSGPRYYSMLLTLLIIYLFIKRISVINIIPTILFVLVSVLTHPFGLFAIPLTIILLYLISSLLKVKLMFQSKYFKLLVVLSSVICFVRLMILSLDALTSIIKPILRYLNTLMEVNILAQTGLKTRFYESKMNTFAAISWAVIPSLCLSHMLYNIVFCRLKCCCINTNFSHWLLALSTTISGFIMLIMGFIDLKTTAMFYVITYSAYALLIPMMIMSVLHIWEKARIVIVVLTFVHVVSAFLDPAINVYVRDQIVPENTLPQHVDYVVANFAIQNIEWNVFRYRITYGPLLLDMFALMHSVLLPKNLYPLWMLRTLDKKEFYSVIPCNTIVLSLKGIIDFKYVYENLDILYVNDKYIIIVHYNLI